MPRRKTISATVGDSLVSQGTPKKKPKKNPASEIDYQKLAQEILKQQQRSD